MSALTFSSQIHGIQQTSMLFILIIKIPGGFDVLLKTVSYIMSYPSGIIFIYIYSYLSLTLSLSTISVFSSLYSMMLTISSESALTLYVSPISSLSYIASLTLYVFSLFFTSHVTSYSTDFFPSLSLSVS